MTIQQMEYFLVLAEEKSFSKAAKRLYISQPSLSQFMKNLEASLNVGLIDRTTVPIRLTAAGEAFAKMAMEVRNAERDFQARLTDINDLKTGSLSIGTSPFRASCMLPESIAAFRSSYPGIHPEVRTEPTGLLLQALEHNELDLCIDANIPAAPQLHTEVLSHETYYLAVPPQHTFHLGREKQRLSAADILAETDHLYEAAPVPISACKDVPFLLAANTDDGFQAMLQQYVADGFQPSELLKTDYMETAFRWCLSGLAFSLIPDTLIRFGNFAKHPAYYKLSETSAVFDIILATKRERYLSVAAKAYIKLLKQLIGQGTWL